MYIQKTQKTGEKVKDASEKAGDKLKDVSDKVLNRIRTAKKSANLSLDFDPKMLEKNEAPKVIYIFYYYNSFNVTPLCDY